MFWDLLNAVIAGGVAAYHAAAALLGPSPLYLPSSLATDLADPLARAAYFLPVAAMTSILIAYVAVLMVWVAFLLIKQLVEAVIP